jgi:hypothetical protein
MTLENWASVATIWTAALAAGVAGYYWHDARQKRLKLEAYLKTRQGKRTYQHTILHLMAELSMTEAEILHACFRSKHIRSLVHEDRKTGLAKNLLLEYADRKTAN